MSDEGEAPVPTRVTRRGGKRTEGEYAPFLEGGSEDDEPRGSGKGTSKRGTRTGKKAKKGVEEDSEGSFEEKRVVRRARKGKGRLGALAAALPVELIAQVMSRCEPFTLLAAARATKPLRALLCTASAQPIWEGAFASVGIDVPFEDTTFNLQKWTALLADKSCGICGRRALSVQLATQRRLCKDCEKRTCWSGFDIKHSLLGGLSRELVERLRHPPISVKDVLDDGDESAEGESTDESEESEVDLDDGKDGDFVLKTKGFVEERQGSTMAEDSATDGESNIQTLDATPPILGASTDSQHIKNIHPGVFDCVVPQSTTWRHGFIQLTLAFSNGEKHYYLPDVLEHNDRLLALEQKDCEEHGAKALADRSMGRIPALQIEGSHVRAYMKKEKERCDKARRDAAKLEDWQTQQIAAGN